MKSKSELHIYKYLNIVIAIVVLIAIFWGIEALGGTEAYASGAGKVVLDEKVSLFVPEGIMFLSDDKGTLAVKDVIALDAEVFNQKESDKSNGPANGARWYRIPVENQRSSDFQLMIEIAKPHLDNIVFVMTDGNGNLLEYYKLGRTLPFSQRLIKHRNFLIPTDLESNSSRICYVRLETTSYIKLPIKFWEQTRFWENTLQDNMTLGVFYGIIIAMILYNLFLYFLLRNRVYLYYVLYIFSFGLLQTVWDGFSYQYLWPDMPELDKHANPVMLSLLAFTNICFVTNFTKVKEVSLKIHKLLVGVGILFAALTVVSAFVDPVASMSIVVPCLGAVMVLTIFVLIIAWKNKREIFYFAYGSLLGMSGYSINLLAAWGVTANNWFTINAPKMGISLEAIVLSFALADTIQRIKQEKEAEEKQKTMLQWLHNTTQRITAVHEPLALINEVNAGITHLFGAGTVVTIIRQDSGYIYQQQSTKPSGVLHIPYEELAGLTSLSEAKKTSKVVALDVKTSEFFNIQDEDIYVMSIGQGDNNEGFLLIDGNMAENQEIMDILMLFLEQIGIAIRNVRAMAKINAMAITDSLTGMLIRSAFIQRAEEVIGNAAQSNTDVSLLVMDIDNFKKINDSYGHDIGDKVISYVAGVLKNFARNEHLVGRFGGDEFMVLLNNTGADGASTFAEDVRKTVENFDIWVRQENVHITLSVGISVLSKQQPEYPKLFKTADMALYLAKEHGRNRVVIK